MTVKEFVTNYNKTKNIEKHITKTYLSYAEKIALCNMILKNTCYEKVSEGRKIFKINTPSRQMLFLLSIIDQYTDIDINWKNPLSDFDELSETKLLGEIIKAVPESEITQFSSLLDMCLDDLMTNTRDLMSWIESKGESLGMALDAILEVVMNSEELKPIIDSLGIGEVLPK